MQIKKQQQILQQKHCDNKKVKDSFKYITFQLVKTALVYKIYYLHEFSRHFLMNKGVQFFNRSLASVCNKTA